MYQLCMLFNSAIKKLENKKKWHWKVDFFWRYIKKYKVDSFLLKKNLVPHKK